MSHQPLKVAFLWHMHQPYYRNPRTGIYRLPWVRLHTVKDYLDMAVRVERSPGIKANFNLVPCLVDQIRDYAAGDVHEVHLELSRRDAAGLSSEEKISLVRHLFVGNRRTMIEPYPRYRSLLQKCSDLDLRYKAQSVIKRFRKQDFLDLQVWSNLAWAGAGLREDPAIAGLFSKQRNFTEDMKATLLEKHMDVMRQVLGKYRSLQEQGRAEISFSPYFHPILPLLCDSEVARVALPGAAMPSLRIRLRDDAKAQINLGRAVHKDAFGKEPSGMWPPEAGVSTETLRLACECGVRWVVADESMLQASIAGHVGNSNPGERARPDLLYRQHRFQHDGGQVSVFFRDRVLSDLISFGYRKWAAGEAVEDFIGRLEAIAGSLGPEAAHSVVVVALDGENCWEFYDRGGDPFLSRLYSELAGNEGIRTVLLSEVLDDTATRPLLETVYPGSWVDGDFGMWIGNDEDNAAWDMLSSARSELKAGESDLPEDKRRAAWQSIYAAEGSDWFWWYGGDHLSREDPEFDALFRAHIRHVYETMGVHVPHTVLQPVMADMPTSAVSLQPVSVIRPVLDGRVTTFYEWKLAGLYESYKDSSRGSTSGRIINAIYFGFDLDNLYLRLDTSISPQADGFTDFTLTIEFEDPAHARFALRAPDKRHPGDIDLTVAPQTPGAAVRAVGLEIVEIAVPFNAIPAKPAEAISFRVSVSAGETVLERRPIHDVITLKVPTPDFEAEMWSTL